MRETRTSADVPLAMTPAEFRAAGHELVDAIADFLQSVPARTVTSAGGPEQVRALLGADAALPEHGTDPREMLRSITPLLFDNATLNSHPRFFGYITGSPAPVGMLADMLAAAVNPNCGAWTLSPVASEIEAQTIRWIAQLIGFPTDCGGLLVSGGNVANFTCFLAARVAQARWQLRQQGLRAGAAAQLTVYASTETHTWIQKAADLYGLGTDAIRWIPTDAALRMRMDALRDAIDQDIGAGHQPLLVVGTAGSVSTGAIDPLREIAGLCRARDIWFHVDGAYGGFAAALPDADPDLKALSLADSVAVDPHKWLYAPLEAGCVLVRDAAALRNAFSYNPAYYHFGIEATNYFDIGQQNSRGFRALKVWLGLRQAGGAGYRRMLGDDIALARRLYERVARHAELEPVTQGLSITTFRYVPPELRATVGEPATEELLNALNRNLLDTLQKEGDVFVSNAVVSGRYLLRACIVNFNTTVADIDAVPELVARAGRRLWPEHAPSP